MSVMRSWNVQRIWKLHKSKRFIWLVEGKAERRCKSGSGMKNKVAMYFTNRVNSGYLSRGITLPTERNRDTSVFTFCTFDVHLYLLTKKVDSMV